MKSRYSLLSEGNVVNGVLATAGMSTLGSKLGEEAGKQIGYSTSVIRHSMLKPQDINWTDPLFVSIVKHDLLTAKENIKLAKEWFDSCDEEDKQRAKSDYQKSIAEYRSIQKDISRRNPKRWIGKYKHALAVSDSEKYSKRGKLIGGIGSGVVTAASFGIPKLLRKK